MKYIPELFIPSIKPRIIDTIVAEENIVVKVAGVNLKPFDASYKSNLDIYLMGVKELRTEGETKLFIEGQEHYNEETLDYIQEFTNMKITSGGNIKLKNLPIAIRKIFALLKEDMQEKEVLIISDDNEKTKRIVKDIAKDLRFITVTGCDHSSNEEIYDYILEETGLSLFYASNIDRILENYSIIINLMDDVNLNFSRVRRNCMIFNFGKNSFLNNTKRIPLIEDFVFNAIDLGIHDVKWINNKIHSDLFEALMGDKAQEIRYIYTGKDYYTLEEYINLSIKIKGKI